MRVKCEGKTFWTQMIAEEIVEATKQYCGQTVIDVKPDGRFLAEPTGGHTHTSPYRHFAPVLSRMNGFVGTNEEWEETKEIEEEELRDKIETFLQEFGETEVEEERKESGSK